MRPLAAPHAEEGGGGGSVKKSKVGQQQKMETVPRRETTPLTREKQVTPTLLPSRVLHL